MQEIQTNGTQVTVKLGGSMYAVDAAALRDAIQDLIKRG